MTLYEQTRLLKLLKLEVVDFNNKLHDPYSNCSYVYTCSHCNTFIYNTGYYCAFNKKFICNKCSSHNKFGSSIYYCGVCNKYGNCLKHQTDIVYGGRQICKVCNFEISIDCLNYLMKHDAERLFENHGKPERIYSGWSIPKDPKYISNIMQLDNNFFVYVISCKSSNCAKLVRVFKKSMPRIVGEAKLEGENIEIINTKWNRKKLHITYTDKELIYRDVKIYLGKINEKYMNYTKITI